MLAPHQAEPYLFTKETAEGIIFLDLFFSVSLCIRGENDSVIG